MGMTFSEALAQPLKVFRVFRYVKYLWSPAAVSAYGLFAFICVMVVAIGWFFDSSVKEFVAPLGWLYTPAVVAAIWQSVALMAWALDNEYPDKWDKR